MKQLETKIKPNKYGLFDIRKFKVPAPHFDYICIAQRYNIEKSIEKWIQDNLKGRFYLGKSYELDKENNATTVIKIGFEEAKELSYFTLACPYLKYY
jgi:hypothetical protein